MRCLLVLFAALISMPAWADTGLVLPRVEFSATAVHQSGAYETRETIHYADGKLRIDRGNRMATTILDLNTQTECILMANHTYLVLPMDDELFRRFFARSPHLTAAHRMGTARIDGFKSTKYAFDENDGLNAAGFFWLSDSGIMLRRDYQDGLFGQTRHNLDYVENVSVARQPASLFMIPPGYKLAK